jgi:hypothetical protein
MGFYGRWGSSCGTAFNVKEFIQLHRQWQRYEPYLDDRPSQPWTYFTSADKPIGSGYSTKTKIKTKKHFKMKKVERNTKKKKIHT